MCGVWTNKDEEVFLIGAQYLDFSDQETRDQVREIERSLESALASDVYDTDGSSHAQEIDGDRNNRVAASQVATLLFISSLSDNTDGIRGLPHDTVIEYLVAPGKEPPRFTRGVRRAPGSMLVPAQSGRGSVVLFRHRERRTSPGPWPDAPFATDGGLARRACAPATLRPRET